MQIRIQTLIHWQIYIQIQRNIGPLYKNTFIVLLSYTDRIRDTNRITNTDPNTVKNTYTNTKEHSSELWQYFQYIHLLLHLQDFQIQTQIQIKINIYIFIYDAQYFCWKRQCMWQLGKAGLFPFLISIALAQLPHALPFPTKVKYYSRLANYLGIKTNKALY